MVDVPRRLTLSGADKVGVIADRAAPGSHRGNTNWSKPPVAKTPTPQSGSAGTASLGRLSVNWHTNDPATDLASRKTTITSWPSAFDDSGISIGLNPAGDDGSIYFFTEGVYAVNLILEASDIGGSSADCSIRFQATIRDTPDSFEIFDVGSRGGDMGGSPGEAPSPGASRVVYSEGRGVAGGGVGFDIATVNLDPLVTTVWVLATVQQIA